MFFNLDLSWYRSAWVDNTPAEVETLMAAASGLVLEGATDVGAALRAGANPHWTAEGDSGWDVFVLSDGASTWGEGDVNRILEPLKAGRAGSFFGYATGLPGTDRRLLDRLTSSTGGAVFGVAGESEVAAVSRAHRSRPWVLRGLELEGARDLLVAGGVSVVYPGQRVHVVGRGKPDTKSVLRLAVARGEELRDLDIAVQHAGDSELAPRVYGQVAVRGLEQLGRAARTEATTFARHFRIAGPSASLLMLESEADYARFNIVPKDDAAFVAEHDAAGVIERIHAQVAKTLGDPRAAFRDFLQRLTELPDARFVATGHLQALVGSLPGDVFALPSSRRQVEHRKKSDIPPPFLKSLETREFDYDSVVAEALRRQERLGSVDGLRALSSLLESRPGDAVLARDVAFQAIDWQLPEAALAVLWRVAAARPDEPQTYHAMALAFAELGRADAAMLYFEVALSGRWQARFGDFRQIVTLDYLRMLRRVEAGHLKVADLDAALTRSTALSDGFGFPSAAVLAVIAWNTDRTDVDLHVVEPSGETCYYGNRETRSGGRLTLDVREGYGPEMYVLQKPVAGDFRFYVKFFASDRQRWGARTKVYATVIERWGQADEKVTRKTVTLDEAKQEHDVARVTMGQ